MEFIKTLLLNFWEVLGQMSPYLLLGFFLSGILSIFTSPKWVEKHLGSNRFLAILKSTILGIPLPLCSCGVIPVAASLRKHGASKGATTAFLLSTPQTGVDSIFATYGLLGPIFAIFRPLAALLTGLVGGTFVSIFDEDFEQKIPPSNNTETAPQNNDSFADKFIKALKYGFITLPSEITKALLIGILIAAFIATFFKADFFASYIGNYNLSMLIMLLVGVPLYVCSTASIPIALGFMKMGFSPGAALVFLVSGPATNAAAISVVWKILGKKSALLYIMTVVVGALSSGYAFDAIYTSATAAGYSSHMHAHHALGFLEHFSAVLMILVVLYSIFGKTSSDSCCSSCASNNAQSEVPVFEINVEGMTCGNCANAVKSAIEEVDGVDFAEINLAEKLARIHGKNPDISDILESVNSLGYTATRKIP